MPDDAIEDLEDIDDLVPGPLDEEDEADDDASDEIESDDELAEEDDDEADDAGPLGQ